MEVYSRKVPIVCVCVRERERERSFVVVMADHQKIHPTTTPLVPCDSFRSENKVVMADHQKIHPTTTPLVPRGSFRSENKVVMADHQKIHPAVEVVDVEAPPTTPLVPRGLFRSENGDPVRQNPPNRTIPVIHSKPPKKRSCCCKCMCWTISLLIILLIIIGVTAAILYAVFQPKLPKYSIDNLKISNFRLNYDMTLYAKFDVKITAKNPNKKIGIYYEKGGRLSVWYTKTKLCEGSLPEFYQGHQNTTVLDVALTGQTEYGSTLMKALQEQQQTGSIPLDLKVDVPVAIKLGKLKLKKVRFLVGCKLVVDSLTANNMISIKTSNCGFRLKL